MVVDLSSRERKSLILHPLVKEFYESNDSKYKNFIGKLHNTFCESGGHKTVQPDNYTTGSCKFKKIKMRGIGFVIDDGNVSIAVINMVWHKNEKNKISQGQMNTAKNKARGEYKALNSESTKGLKSYISSAIQDDTKLVLDC